MKCSKLLNTIQHLGYAMILRVCGMCVCGMCLMHTVTIWQHQTAAIMIATCR